MSDPLIAAYDLDKYRHSEKLSHIQEIYNSYVPKARGPKDNG